MYESIFFSSKHISSVFIQIPLDVVICWCDVCSFILCIIKRPKGNQGFPLPKMFALLIINTFMKCTMASTSSQVVCFVSVQIQSLVQ